jgi:hypothetical protein
VDEAEKGQLHYQRRRSPDIVRRGYPHDGARNGELLLRGSEVGQ